MYINVGGDASRLNTGTYKAIVTIDSWTPEHTIWVSVINGTLHIIAHPKNLQAATVMADLHNEIYNSPLAEALREDT